ncbi:hypothetical protein [Paenibacillus sp. GYB003]|uniref:hypothetical protein n=1 Tax=Paenibacillus sp. GYB003 TaxID=2994392 RepID=UPI002F96CB9F
MRIVLSLALVFAVPAAGVFVYAGYPLRLMDDAIHPAKTERSGVSFHAGFAVAVPNR